MTPKSCLYYLLHRVIINRMTERDIQKILFENFVENRHTRKFRIAAPNIHLFPKWESDFLGLTSYGYIHEFEIKLSKSDYLADFNKVRKHNTLRSFHRSKSETFRVPKRFYYVIHGFHLSAGELPDYAGLITINGSVITKLRTAPDLPAIPITSKQTGKIATSLCYRYWNLL